MQTTHFLRMLDTELTCCIDDLLDLPAEVGAMLMKALESGMDQVVKDVSAETSETPRHCEAQSDEAISDGQLAALLCTVGIALLCHLRWPRNDSRQGTTDQSRPSSARR